jgi:hypothetical protein
MIKNMRIIQGLNGKWVASCRSTKFGDIEQWGNTPEEAMTKLEDYVTKHWQDVKILGRADEVKTILSEPFPQVKVWSGI